MSFVHLHVHSEYSLLDGLSRIRRLVDRAKSYDMPAVALTDHGAMFGVIDFYRAAKQADIKPIIGIETYMAARGMQDRDPQQDARSFHLLLLAENDIGYRNLLQIASDSQLDGFYYRPRIDHDYLATHSEGLICTTGCLSGEVPRAIQYGQHEKAVKLLDWYYEVFGPDRFFFELQHHDIPELPEVNKKLLELGKRYQARFVATNDVHYVDRNDAELQDILLCIQTGSLRADPDRMRMTDNSYHLRSPQEMQELFGHVPDALENTLLIAERCNVNLDFKGYHLPEFEVPEGYTTQSYLRMLCEKGMRKRYGEQADNPVYRERLDYELGIINQMGFDAYFLIVWDLCRFAQEQGIWYNARGSAAGSIVAYCLDITLVDPIKHGLIFERFLNPGRVSMPDIDLDFQDDLRYQLLEYTANKYGRDKVAQIITFGTLGARAAIRDVGRVMDIPLPEVDRVAKLVPAIPGKPVTIPEALEQVTELKHVYDETSYLKELINTAAQLEGVSRNAGTHAAGVIVTDKPIVEYIPLHRPTGSSAEDSPIGAVTQFEMQILDSLGLLKIDFLGLSTLTVMARACDLINERHGVDLDIHSIPLDDPDTYELLGRGDVLGVFQVEGAGMRRHLMEMKPRELANVVAMVALYRPGPLQFIPDYIRRMHGLEDVAYLHPELEPILKETYGITVYQEQIMYTAMNLADYSASEADNLRKAVAKKKAAVLEKHRAKFTEGAVAHGIPAATANEIFEQWEAFARYGFPKGHAADYAVICVQTAYLKAHYPVEYMTALLSVFKHDTDKVALYIADCRRMGFDVLPPDINLSGIDFTIEELEEKKPAIRYGMSAVKNVGDGAVEIILEARREGGPFENLENLAHRVDLRQVGRRALECLVRVGALDSFGSRIAILESLERLMSISVSHFRAEEVGQLTFFGGDAGMDDTLHLPEIHIEVPLRRQLSWERELLGVYVSDHPLTPYLEDLTQIVSHFSVELDQAAHGQSVCVAGEISHVRPYQTRTGKAMGFITLEDLQGSMELVIFSRVWSDIQEWIEPELIVLVKGKIDSERGDPKILVDEITTEFKMVSSADPLPGIEEPAEPKTHQPQAKVPIYDDLPPLPERDPWEVDPADELGAVEVTDGIEPHLEESPTLTEAQAGVDGESNLEADVLVEPEQAGQSNPGLEAVSSLRGDGDRCKVTVMIRSTGDKQRDSLRMRRVHGLLTSYPGQDRFAFQVFESARHYHLEFPSSTTGFCSDLQSQLQRLLGEGSVIVEPLRYQ